MSNSSNQRRRVVISGVGIISPIGIGVASVWDSLQAQRNGVTRIERLAATAVPGHVGGEAKGFTEETAKKLYLKAQRKSIKIMCREIQLGVAAANLAIEDGALNLETIDHDRLGIEFGANQMFSPPATLGDPCFAASPNGDFEFDQWGPAGMGKMEPLWLLKYLPNMPACHIGIHADARGPNNSLTLAEASGNSAIGEALRIIQGNRADMMLAGTCGGRIHPVKSLHAALYERLADFGDAEPATWCRPFDATRRGQVVGEGACVFVMEEEAHAQARGAKILGTILGTGSSCSVERDGRPNYRQAINNAVRIALRDAGLTAADIGHINAHGLGDPIVDIEEAAAIGDIFGDRAASIPVTAAKSFLGNSGAACGMLELAMSLIAMQQGFIPATANYANPDPQCPLNVVHGELAQVTNKVMLKINVTGNAQAAAVIACGA